MAQHPARRSGAKATGKTKAAPHGRSDDQASEPKSKPAAKAPAKRPKSEKKSAARTPRGGAAASAGVAQSAEQGSSKPKAAGSSPAPRSTVDTILAAEPIEAAALKFTPSVRAFIEEYLRDLNGCAAYLRIHPGVTPGTAGTESWRILKNPDVRSYIEQRRERIALEIDFTSTDWLREQVAVALADPGELTQMRQVSCDHCWPREVDQASGKPVEVAMWQEPNPECPHCAGDGIPRAYFADTRKLSPGARRLFQSVEVTRQGMKIKLRDQDAALERLGRALGVYEIENRQKADATAAALREFFTGLHGAGANLPIAAPQPRNAPKDAPGAKATRRAATPAAGGNPLVQG